MKLGVVKCPCCGEEWKGAVADASDRLQDENGDLFVPVGGQGWGRIAVNNRMTDKDGNSMVRNDDGSWAIIGRAGVR